MNSPTIDCLILIMLASSLLASATYAQTGQIPNRQEIAEVAEIQDLMSRQDSLEVQRLMDGDSLVAHYPFDKDANDVSGKIEPIDGIAIKEILKGKHGGALRFDGQTSVEIPVDLSADVMPEFTVSMWLKADRLPSDEAALKKLPNSAIIASDLLSLHSRKTNTPSLYSRVPGTKFSASQHRIRPGQWVHVAVTRKVEDRENREGKREPHLVTRIYSEGRSSEGAGAYRNSRHQPSVYLGSGSAVADSYSFTGLIDDLKIYRVAMSEAQISALKAGGTTAQSSGDQRKQPASSNDTGNSDPDIALPGSIGGLSEASVASSPLDTLKDAAQVDGPTLSLPDGSVESTTGGLPTADASAERKNSTPLVPGGISGGPGSIDTSTGGPTREPVAMTVPDTAPIGGRAPGPVSNPQTNPIDTQPVDDAAAIGRAKAARDWRLLDLDLASPAENDKLTSGNRVKFRVVVSRHDRGNHLPGATLSLTAIPSSGGQPVVQRLPLSQSGDGVRKTYSLLMELPTVGSDGRPLSTTNLLVTGRIDYPEDLKGIDDNLANNAAQASYVINKPIEGVASANQEDCVESTSQGGDSRTQKSCIGLFTGPGSTDVPRAKYQPDFTISFDDNLMVYTDVWSTTQNANATPQNLLLNVPLSSVVWGEKNDKPCRMEIDGIRLGEDNDSTDFCGGSGGFDSGNYVTARNPNEVVTGIRVCRNHANRRMKGLSFEFRTIDRNGELSFDKRVEHEEKTNCAHRTNWDYCTDGTIARGLQLRIADGTFLFPLKYIHSVNLICATPIIDEG